MRSPAVARAAATAARRRRSPRSSRGRRGARTSRSAGASRPTRRSCATRSSTTRPARTRYTKAQVPAILRGIQLYHVKANGWNDIGYNFLVDRFGTVYEGRYGGIDANVIGAQAQGFNTGSVGVALLGTYEGERPSTAAESGARAGCSPGGSTAAHVDPGSMLTVVSGGSPKFAAGVPVLLRAVSGHRDVGSHRLSRRRALRAGCRRSAPRRVAAGLPKLYEPCGLRRGGVGRPSGRGSRRRSHGRSASPTAGSSGRERRAARARRSSGRGTPRACPRATTAGRWRRAPALDRGHTCLGDRLDRRGRRAACGERRRGRAAARVTERRRHRRHGAGHVRPDGAGDRVHGCARRRRVSRWPRSKRRAGGERETTPLSFDGAGLPDGAYTLQLRARSASGAEATASTEVIVSRTLGFAALAPPVFSPNGDGRADVSPHRLHAHTPGDRHRAGHAGRSIRRDDLQGVRSRLDGGPCAGTDRRPVGTIGDGSFSAVVEADDGAATARIELPFTSRH